MAKLKSLIKVEGTLDDLTFYKGKEGYYVRTKGGVNGNRVKNDPAFARTRENGEEFGHSAKSGKVLRRSIQSLLVDVKDGSVTARLTQVMSRVKNADGNSERGKRNVKVGLSTPLGKIELIGFDFNKNAIIDSMLMADYLLDTTTGEIEIVDFVPNQQVVFPEGATHVTFTAGFLNLDFETKIKELQISNLVNLPINGTATTVTLTPAAVPTGTGQRFYLLKVAFFQEINGIQYPLKNGAFNALKLLEVLD